MPLPPAIGTCTISGQFEVLPSAVANVGSVTFTLPTALYDTTDHVILSAAVYTAVLAADGTFSIALPYNDNAGVTPTGWSYLVTENIVDGRDPYYIQVTRSLGATAKLDELAQSPTPSGPVFPQPWIPVTLILSKGDLVAGSGAGVVVRVPAGADGTVLTAESSQPGGVAFVASAGGPPSGAASGDLSGTYPAPTLAATANVNGIIRANRLDQLAAPTNPVAMGGQKITGGAAGTAGTDFVIVNQLPTPGRDRRSSMLGLLGQPFDFGVINDTGLGLTSGFLILMLCEPDPGQAAGLNLFLGGAGSGITGVANVCAYTEAGNRVGLSADVSAQLSNPANADSVLALPFGSSFAVDGLTAHYVGVFCQMSSNPTIGGVFASLHPRTVNGHRPAIVYGGLSSVPATINVSSATTAGAAYWFGLYS